MDSKIWFTAVLLLAVVVDFEAFPMAVEEDLNEDSNEMDYPKDYDDDDDEHDDDDDNDDDNDRDGNYLSLEDLLWGRELGLQRPRDRRPRSRRPKQRGSKKKSSRKGGRCILKGRPPRKRG